VSDSSPGCSALGKETHYSFDTRLLGSRAGLNVLEKIKISCPYQVRTQDRPPRTKIYINPYTDLKSSGGFQKFDTPRFQDNQHIKGVRLLALPTDRL
jgi:hypothetical protein